MKEYEKLLFEEAKRKAMQQALEEINLGLFEQKQEEKFDFSLYTKMTYDKKYKGLYDLYQNNETKGLVLVCPLIENNKGDDYNERKDLSPYAYDILDLEYLDEDTYKLVKQAAVHEKSKLIHVFYYASIILYCLLFLFTLGITIYFFVTSSSPFAEIPLLCGSLWGGLGVFTALMPIVLIQYRKSTLFL